MKDSGVAWIGEIPADWEIVRFKNLMTRKSKKLSPAFMPGAISFGQVVEKDEDKITNETKATYQEVLVGEILINPINLNYDLKSLRTALSDINVCVSSAYIVACPNRQANKSWLKNMMYCFDVNHMKTLGAGVRQTITFDDIGNCVTTKPPLAEQRAIADYLDRQTALIDQRLSTLAEKKTVLAELRKATIHEAVTKGLNKNATMKDSGNIFIGKIPVHWGVRRIKDISTKIGSGKTPLGGSNVYVTEGVTFLRSQNVWDEGLFLDDVVYIADAVDREMKGSRVKVGDILINVTGASIGRSCLVPDGVVANVNQHVCIVRLRNKRFASFVARSMQAYSTQRQIAEVQVGAAREGLNFEQIGNLFIVSPPPEEQRAIAKHLDQRTQHIDAQLATLDEQAQLLKELRKAIIHEAVTGKIDLSGT
jgi:type I restriction enzyme S subunit